MAERVTVSAFVKQRGGKELASVFTAVAEACVRIEKKIRLAGLSDTYGALGTENVQGEVQQKLDVFVNDALIEALRAVPAAAAVVSEEDEGPVDFSREGAGEKFVVIFDPLDGSSNIDVNVNVGTIVSVQKFSGDVTLSALAGGSEQVAAMYVVYGPSCVMVLALPGGAGVASFTLNDAGEFLLTAEDMRMPEQGPYYSTNEANEVTWPAQYQAYVNRLRRGELNGKAYGSRYIGSLVADFHRTLLKGGVFLYPPTKKQPGGKLRLLYEANPLAFVAEQAGGMATNGVGRILEIEPEKIHQRTAFCVGGRQEMEALVGAVSG